MVLPGMCDSLRNAERPEIIKANLLREEAALRIS